MKFTPIKLNLPSVADDAGSDRNPGLHVSGIIKHLLMQLDPKKYSKGEDTDTRLLWELGLAWEDIALSRSFWTRILKRTYPKASFKQVQCSLDDIWGTCDMITLGDRTLITESKLTRYSMVHHPKTSMNFWSWRVQMMAYCKMWGGTDALLPVCFLNGDYRPKIITARAWDITFEQDEIEDNWSMMLQARDEIIKLTKKEKRKNRG